jgi:small-conductance mechanosensitive channel
MSALLTFLLLLQEPAILTAPVVVDGTALFSVRGVSAFPAEQRAGDIAARIVAVARNPELSRHSLKLSETREATQILAGDQPLMTVVDADAEREGIRRHILATALMLRVGDAIDDYRSQRQPAFLLRQTFYALAAATAFLLVIITVRRARRAAELRFRERIREIRIQSVELVSAEKLHRILARAASFLTGFAVLAAGYLCIDYILFLFPWTRGTAANLFSYLAEPLRRMGRGTLQVIPDLLFLTILVLVTRYILVLIRAFFDAIRRGSIAFRGFEPEWALPTYRLVWVVTTVLAIVVAYPYIPGSDSDAFKGLSLFIGVLLSLGSTSLIGNILAGYTLTYRRSFRRGDRVRIGEHTGYVEQSRLMSTFLRTPKNEIVVVPNSKIVNEEVVNYSTLARRGGLILHTTVGIGYGVPWRQVEAMLLEAAARTPGLLPKPAPFVRQKALGDFAVTYEINGYCDRPRRIGRVYTLLHQNILDVFNEYGVQIMTPAYEGDPEDRKIVSRDRWYDAPAGFPDRKTGT